MILSPPVLLPQVYGFLFIVSCIQSFDFTLTSHFDFLNVGFISSSNRPIAKLKKGVEQSKPHADKPKQSKLAVVKNTSSKPKRRSQWIASKLDFLTHKTIVYRLKKPRRRCQCKGTRLSLQRMNKKKQDSSVAFEGGHSSNNLLESEDGHFLAD